ncbi:MAG: very short patch repair endonuclease [Nitrososphaerota archaeon]|nr:very short patch repair endonuclease [Nitrososphaerota archaeon]
MSTRPVKRPLRMKLTGPASLKKVPRPPLASSPRVSVSMRGNRGKGTGPEERLVAALKSTGVRGLRRNAHGLPGRPDLVFTKSRLVVFVHGCFWHRCPHHRWALPKSNTEYWRLKFRLNQERDKRKERELKEAGWRVLTVWECEIHEKLRACVEEVRGAVSLDDQGSTR